MNSEAFEKLKPYLAKKRKLGHLISLINWDMETIAPEKALDAESDLLVDFYGESVQIDQDPEYIRLVKEAFEDKNVNERQRCLLVLLQRSIDFAAQVPADTLRGWTKDVNKCIEVWKKCKHAGDYENLLPYFRKVVDNKREEATLKGKPYHHTRYDALLEDYEAGYSEEVLDKIFGVLRDFLKENLQKAIQKQESLPGPPIGAHPRHEQQKLSLDVLRLEGFDLTRGCIGEAEHPFTDWPAQFDFRVTTHYYEEDWRMSLFSVLHEGGHAIHGQLWPQTHYDDFVNSLATSAICETHSRFFENIVGRSEFFAPHLLDLCRKDLGGEFLSMDVPSFVAAIRHVQPSLVRTESDEFTYCLHIIIRYELERDLINGVISVDELPALWNAKYREYLGIDVPNNTLGILQDTHWFSGLFGYFPSYALGNLCGAQLLHAMRKDLSFEQALSSGSIEHILNWLASHDVCNDYLPPNEWLKASSGEYLNPTYFLDYLKSRYL